MCIFPEGKITRDGQIDVFRAGIEKILAKDPVPVIPMALQGLWGTWFSLEGGKAIIKAPRKWLTNISLVVGKRIPGAQASAETLAIQVKSLFVAELPK